MEAMRQELDAAGHRIDVVAINVIGGEGTQALLAAQCSFDLVQDVPEVWAWALMGGGKDDLFVYREGGVLAPSGYLPFGGPVNTNLSTAAGYAAVRDVIVAVDGMEPEGCARCAFEVARGTVAPGSRGTSVKIPGAAFDPGMDSYTGNGEDIVLVVDGRRYLAPGPTRKLTVSRGGNKIAIKDHEGKLAIDLRKKTLTLALKRIPAGLIEATDGLGVEVALAGVTFRLEAAAAARGRKFLLQPARGEVELPPDFTPCR
jgi:hypothetical protein